VDNLLSMFVGFQMSTCGEADMRGAKAALVAAMIAVFPEIGAAADLKAPAYKAPPVPAAAQSWTGCHVGIEGGGAWGNSQHIQDDTQSPGGFGLPLTNDFGVTGALFGGTVGCDYQVNSWAIGLENDISWTNLKGSGNLIPPFTPATNVFETNEHWLDTLRLRIGLTWDRWFLYGTGGAAFSEVGINLCSPLAVACGSSSRTVTGWTAGVGAEYAFWRNWSAKVEYLHVDLGNPFFPEIQVTNGFYLARDVKLTNDIVRAGVNYKLDWFAP
jgi:outer membrane immunogenic protein